ncbi:MAG: DUF1998 domain-containing protein [Blautia sp.]|nr:DUF1998 domain-containing protein [Blautia sp.]
MKEVHLYIAPQEGEINEEAVEGEEAEEENAQDNGKRKGSPVKMKSRARSRVKPCYLDVRNGFVNFLDDSLEGLPYIRKLFFSDFVAKGRPDIITFSTCPQCEHLLSTAQLSSFSTGGNQSFYNLIRSQFDAQPPVAGKDHDIEHFPNQGRKVLLFSDSRQRAARLARDMSENSEMAAARQLVTLAIRDMEQMGRQEYSLDTLYDFFCLEASQHHVPFFHDEEREKFRENCESVLRTYALGKKRGRDYRPRYSMASAPIKMQEALLRLFAGGYNTLYDAAISWIEPTGDSLWNSIDEMEEYGLVVSKEEFLEVFHAWMMYICDSYTALGNTISDEVRLRIRPLFNTYGLERNWKFPKRIRQLLGWEEENEEEERWKATLQKFFLESPQVDTGRYYVDLSQVRARFDRNHTWYVCRRCTEISPFRLKGHCPICGSLEIEEMTEADYAALAYWRAPVEEALKGGPISVMDTQEHTAQLSHKDHRDEMWSRTEEYELRFQDLVKTGETPVDVLSSSTTMEVGIDIGSLVAVGLRNIPPMRENYQQRAGRAGRRGSSLSTIVTFCEDGPHDTLYFQNPIPMFRGDPRRPWIDVSSEKLLQRHLSMVILQEYLEKEGLSLDSVASYVFLDTYYAGFLEFLKSYQLPEGSSLLPPGHSLSLERLYPILSEGLRTLRRKRLEHPELYGAEEFQTAREKKSLLDALYEEGLIPTYSFPKNVVSTYISDQEGRIRYEVERGLDIAIGEYAPGRSIVVDKQTYQIGGMFFPGSEKRKDQAKSPARAYMEDGNYVKGVLTCPRCEWFGLLEEKKDKCPFCGNEELVTSKSMLRPWGFAPRNAEAIQEAQLNEQYSYVQEPLYSTLPEAESMRPVRGYENLRMASRTNQRIIMMNKGPMNRGFMVCKDCGAMMPGDDAAVLKGVDRPYKSRLRLGKCSHSDTIPVNLGYDFVTDMLVLEVTLNTNQMETGRSDNPWLKRAARSLAEALRLAASKELDVEFTELVTGYRLRQNSQGAFVDIYLYDSLSSGAGYAERSAQEMEDLLASAEEFLSGCNCSSACYNCLKHYRNQHVHGSLDRFAALELLHWMKDSSLARALSGKEQRMLFDPLASVLEFSGCVLSCEEEHIYASKDGKKKEIEIYPAMWVEPKRKNTIFVSDAYMKYAKPYAVKKILEEIWT